MNRARRTLVVAVVLALVAVGPVAATAGPPRTTNVTASGPPGGGSGTATVNDAPVPIEGTDPGADSTDKEAVDAAGTATATVGGNDSTANETAGDPTSNETPEDPFGENESATSTGEMSRTIDREPVYEPSYSIPFRSETVTPEPGLDPAIADTERSFVWVLVQFVEPQPSNTTRRLRSEYGYQEGYGVTETAVYAGVPRDRAESLAEDPAVRSVTAIRPEWRVEPLVVDAIEKGEDAEGVRDDETPGGVWVTVVAFESLDYEWLTPSGELTYTGTLRPEQFEQVANDNGVAYVERRFPMTAQTAEGRTLVGADLAQRNGGLTGQGVTVGVLDSGLTRRHDHFQNTGLTAATNDAWGDNCDHGTHVAGTIAGNDTSSARAGVAPDADLVVAKYLKLRNDGDCTGRKAPRRIYGRVRNRGARIISNSWGNDGKGRYGWTARVTDKWVRNHRDTLLVFANGNNDRNERQWMHSPGLAKNVLTVGALHDGTTDAGTKTPNSIRLTERDSSINDLVGPRDVDPQGGGSYSGSGRVHPTVYAPGENVSAPDAGTQSGYTSKDGTSMAAPYVSGAAALYKETHPNAGANQMRAAIVATTTDGPGYGVVNANDLVKNNRYEITQQYLEGSVSSGDSDIFQFSMPKGVEEMTVSLSWIDPPRKSWLKPSKQKGFLSNDLELFAGPDGEPRKYRVTHEGNVKKLVIEDPTPGEWEFRVHGRAVTAFTSQKFGAVFRLVHQEPTVDVEATGGTLPVGPSVGVPVRIAGTGAPVSGARVELSTDSGIQLCSPGTVFVGDVSNGYSRNVTPCVTALNSGRHNLTVQVRSPSLSSPVQENVTIHVPENQPPETVENVRSPTHEKFVSASADRWSSQPTVKLKWDPASDNGPAGTAGYYVELSDHQYPTKPMNGSLATVNSTGAGNTTATVTVPDSDRWYVHVKAYDAEGNVGDANTSGPYQIDVEPPRITAIGHQPNAYSLGGAEGNASFEWYARDDRSGVTKYVSKLRCVAAPPGTQCRARSPTVHGEYETRASFDLDPGKYNFTVQPVDGAGNAGAKTTDQYYVDRSPPTASIAGTRYTGKAFDNVTFDAGPSTDDIEVVEYRWEFGDGETANTTDPTVNHKYRVMTRTNATVTVVDGGGQTDTDAVNVTIAPGIKDQPRDPEDFELNYVGPRPGEWLDEGPPKSREELERAAELVGVGIRPTEPHDELTLGVTTAVEPTEDVPSIPDGATTLGDYVAVDAPATFAGDARVQFRIEKETLSELQVGTESVSILHGKNGAEGWDRPDTAVVGEDDEHYTVAAESDGFSTFVVVLADPGNDETEPSPETDSPEGEQSETTTTEEPREDPTPTERATPPQNASNTTETGSEDPSTEPDESTPPTDGQSTASDDGFELPQPGFGPLVALLALVLGLLAVRRRS